MSFRAGTAASWPNMQPVGTRSGALTFRLDVDHAVVYVQGAWLNGELPARLPDRRFYPRSAQQIPYSYSGTSTQLTINPDGTLAGGAVGGFTSALYFLDT